MSDGTLKLFAYYMLLHEKNPRQLVFIEEPENGLYHQYLADLAIEMSKNVGTGYNKQLFVTTHSPFFVNALSPEQVWVLDKGADGFSTIKRSSEYDFVSDLVQEGAYIGDLWNDKYFGSRNGRDKNDVKHIKGINLCMWAEWIPSGELLMYMTYPRAMAVSETAWGSHKDRPSLEDFEKKMETHKKRFQKRFGYTLERTVENKPYRESSITQEEIDRINANYKKGQQDAGK